MLLSEVAEQYGVSADAIAGVYPCTPLQEEMMDLSLRGRTTQFAHECEVLAGIPDRLGGGRVVPTFVERVVPVPA